MSCVKVRYDDEEGARFQAKQQRASGKENKKIANKLHHYLCGCGFWHVGHDKYRGKQYPKSAKLGA